jgi:hypothetical protein
VFRLGCDRHLLNSLLHFLIRLASAHARSHCSLAKPCPRLRHLQVVHSDTVLREQETRKDDWFVAVTEMITLAVALPSGALAAGYPDYNE